MHKTVSGERYTDIKVLQERLVWALLTYSDGSQFCFQTTFNEDILREYGIVLEENSLPRLDKQYYWGGRYVYRQFPFEGAKVSLWSELTYTHLPSRELHGFL